MADYEGLQINFDYSPQIIEIDIPGPRTDDPNRLIIQTEETVEFDNARSPNAENIEAQQDADMKVPIIVRFPVKGLEELPPGVSDLTINDIMKRMNQKEIGTSEALSNEMVHDGVESNVATTPQFIEQDEMEAEEIVSNISSDEDDFGSGDGSPDAHLPDAVPRHDIQPFVTTSQFINSIQTRQVLVLLKTKIYFHGALRIRLIAGNANIFESELIEGETVSACSPRNNSLLYVGPSPNDHHPNDHDMEVDLHKLTEDFVRSDLERIVCNFNVATDAIVLLESDNSCISLVEDYMKEMIFPDPEAFDRHTIGLSESILQCRLFTHTQAGLRVNSQWNEIMMMVNDRQLVVGGKGTGKSTYVRYSINRNLQEFGKILLIDLDVCLPEVFVPQTVSATVIREPMLCPGYMCNITPLKAYMFGDVDVLMSPIKYFKCVLKLIEYCSSRDELKSMPWVINTMAFGDGFDLEMTAAIIRAVNPTALVQIRSSGIDDHDFIPKVVNNFPFGILDEEVQHTTEEVDYTTYVCNPMATEKQQEEWIHSERDLRYAMILSRLGSVLEGNFTWITDITPVW